MVWVVWIRQFHSDGSHSQWFPSSGPRWILGESKEIIVIWLWINTSKHTFLRGTSVYIRYFDVRGFHQYLALGQQKKGHEQSSCGSDGSMMSISKCWHILAMSLFSQVWFHCVSEKTKIWKRSRWNSLGIRPVAGWPHIVNPGHIYIWMARRLNYQKLVGFCPTFSGPRIDNWMKEPRLRNVKNMFFI